MGRERWLQLHLYAALVFGLFLAVLGLTGSLSVYGEALDRLLNPRFSIEPTPATRPTLDELMAVVRRQHPDNKGAWTLELPETPADPLTAWYDNPIGSAGKIYAPLMVSLNPYTGDILASREWGSTFRTWILDLHTQLHWGALGQTLVGLSGLVLVVSVLSGLYLWWPGLAGLRHAFRLVRDQGMKRFVLDLHRLLGVLGFAALLVLAITGLGLAFPDLTESLFASPGMGHNAGGPAIRSTALSSPHRPVGIEEAVLLARGPFPRAEVRTITTPAGPEGTYRITFRQHFEASRHHPMTAVWVDQYSGQIREVRNAARFSAAETAMTWIWPLHTAEALGGWGRLAWFLSGLLLPVLYVSGLVRWLIARGSVPDRPLELEGFNHAAARLTRWFRQILVTLRQQGYPLMQQALRVAGTRLRQALGKLSHWLDQHRSGR